MDEVVFALEPGGPYAEPTAGRDASVDLWCNDDSDILIVRNDSDGVVVSELESRVGVRHRLADDDHAIVVTDACLKHTTRTVEPTIIAHECLLVPPLRYANGKKVCRVWGLDGSNLTDLYQELRSEWTVSIESKRSIDHFNGPVSGLQIGEPSLSDRQHEAVQIAIELGYYEIPRQVTTEELAEAMGIERRTAETHLRLAEQKIVEAVIGRQ